MLGSVYLGATLFGLSVGIYDLASGSAARSPAEVVLQVVVAVWWGVTLTGFLLLLWPAAYLTHLLLSLEPGTLTRRRG